MSTISHIKAFEPSAFIYSLSSKIKACTADIYEFFTQYKTTLEKINTLNRKIFDVETHLNCTDTLHQGMVELKELLLLEVDLQKNQNSLNLKIRQAYRRFGKKLEHLQKQASPERIKNWLNIDSKDQNKEKTTIFRWLQATPAQRRFAVYYHLSEVPLKYSEIPAGSILLTDPYSYLRHMQLEKKTHRLKSIIIKIKALLCRFFTGKQFTHVDFCMGNGKIFDLDKKEGYWLQGEGVTKNKKDHIFYGVVIVPQEQNMLNACNSHLPNAPCITFQDLMNKINAKIETATQKKAIQLNLLDIIKTIFTQKRPIDYDCTQAWQEGACHYSCSGTTSALLSQFGIDIGKQFNKVDMNVTPTDFFHSRFFHLINGLSF